MVAEDPCPYCSTSLPPPSGIDFECITRLKEPGEVALFCIEDTVGALTGHKRRNKKWQDFGGLCAEVRKWYKGPEGETTAAGVRHFLSLRDLLVFVVLRMPGADLHQRARWSLDVCRFFRIGVAPVVVAEAMGMEACDCSKGATDPMPHHEAVFGPNKPRMDYVPVHSIDDARDLEMNESPMLVSFFKSVHMIRGRPRPNESAALKLVPGEEDVRAPPEVSCHR